ncbi:MAG: hypothetical protein K9H41_01180 [Bacteroidia bacterium]|nr:hypothetical protein [Bacteroidia bacterium]
MKNKILIILLITTVNLFCQQKAGSTLSSNTINFARIIRYTVFVKDTATLKNAIQRNDSNYQISTINQSNSDLYIDQLSFNQFINVIFKYLNDKNSKAYLSNGTQINKVDLKKRVIKSDSIAQIVFEADGTESEVKLLSCDSTYLYSDVNSIEFTESWYIDPKTYELKKEVLSYSLRYFDYEREFYRDAITIYRSEEAVKKINDLVK